MKRSATHQNLVAEFRPEVLITGLRGVVSGAETTPYMRTFCSKVEGYLI